MTQVIGKTREGDRTVNLTRWPDECPRCHANIDPPYLTGFLASNDAGYQAVFRCTRDVCQGLFIGRYRVDPGTGYYNLHDLAPKSPAKVSYGEEITVLSPTFVKIMNQVEAADSHQLDQLVGIGLRKALEFLVKDFAIGEHPTAKAGIEGIMLGPCISKYITDANVQFCASRATWLGNDETHYVRKWTNMDISNLRDLIRLAVMWIEANLLTKKYKDEMKEGK